MGEAEQALEYLNLVLDFEPNNTRAKIFKNLLQEDKSEFETFDYSLLDLEFPQTSKAVSLFLRKEYNQAIKASNECLQLVPNNYVVQQVICESLLKQQKFQECLAMAEQSLAIFSTNIKANRIKIYTLIVLNRSDEARAQMKKAKFLEGWNNINLGFLLLNQGNFQDAKKCMEPFFQDSSEHQQNLLNQMFGFALANNNQSSEAFEYFDKVKTPNNTIRQLVFKGATLWRMSEFDEAIKHFQKVAILDKNYKELWIILAQILSLRSRNEEALQVCETYLAFDKNCNELQLTRNDILRSMGKNSQSKHQQDFEKLEENINPNDFSLLKTKGVELKKKKCPHKAIKIFDQILQSYPQLPDVLVLKGKMVMQLACCLLDAKLFQDALDFIDKNNLIEQPEIIVESLQCKGIALFYLKQYPQALDFFSQVENLCPSYYYIQLCITHCLFKMGKLDEAYLMYYNLFQSANDEDKKQYYFYHCVKCLYCQKQYPQALKEIVNNKPLNSTYYDNLEIFLIVLLGKMGYFKQALDFVTDLIQLYQKNQIMEDLSLFYYFQGDNLHKLGRQEEALKILKEVLEKTPSLTLAWILKGNCLQELTLIEDARQCFEKVKNQLGQMWTPQLLEDELLKEIEKLESQLNCLIKEQSF